jgi:hypothetical protein
METTTKPLTPDEVLQLRMGQIIWKGAGHRSHSNSGKLSLIKQFLGVWDSVWLNQPVSSLTLRAFSLRDGNLSSIGERVVLRHHLHRERQRRFVYGPKTHLLATSSHL